MEGAGSRPSSKGKRAGIPKPTPGKESVEAKTSGNRPAGRGEAHGLPHEDSCVSEDPSRSCKACMPRDGGDRGPRRHRPSRKKGKKKKTPKT